MTGYTFDWQEEKGGYHGGGVAFHDWLLVTALGGDRQELMEKVSEASSRFTEVTFEFLINGHPVDTERILRELDKAFDDAVERGAREKLAELVNPPVLTRLQDDAHKFAQAFRSRASEILREAGTPDWAFPDWED